MSSNRGPTATRLTSVAIGLFLLLVARGCATPEEPFYQSVTPAEAEALVQSHAEDARFVIMDVRTPEEFAAGHIAGAINLCVNCETPVFSEALASLDKVGTYLVYCGSQRRSPLAIAAMQEQGFLYLYELTGGLTQWAAENLPVTS